VIRLPQPINGAVGRSSKLADVEREHIRTVLESTGWRVRGACGAAERLGLKPTTLETRMAKLGLKRPRPL
jgi:transcriptional regulator with GAF, ATPase, and Fis domain